MNVSRITMSIAFGLALALAGCTHAGPPSGADLDARLVTAGQLPTGWTVEDRRIATPPGHAAGGAPDCLSVGAPKLFLDGSGATTGAIATVDYASGGNDWLGFEYLFSYSDDGAHAALAQLRSLANQCGQPMPVGSGATLKFTISSGPALGDESLAFHSTITTPDGLSGNHEAIFIRSANVLLVVAAGPPRPDDSQASDDALLTQLASATYAAYAKP